MSEQENSAAEYERERVIEPPPEEVEKKPAEPLRFTFIETEAIFEKLSPPEWACEKLGICPGRPILVQGFGGSGKTIAVQSMALAMAVGREMIWGSPDLQVKGGLQIVHIDYDQGTKPTMRRYQRLSAGMGIKPDELCKRLRMVGGPNGPCFTLDNPRALESLVENLQGVDICIIDSLRGALPTVDENSSDIRTHIDKLRFASEQLVKTSFIMIHHEGKTERADARHAGRGSSGIYDAAGSVIRLEVDPERGDNAPVLVSQSKSSQEAIGGKFKPFWIHITNDPSEPDKPKQFTPDGMPALAVVVRSEQWVDEHCPRLDKHGDPVRAKPREPAPNKNRGQTQSSKSPPGAGNGPSAAPDAWEGYRQQ